MGIVRLTVGRGSGLSRSMVRSRRAVSMLLTALFVGAALAVTTGAPPAGADVYGDLKTVQGNCLSAYAPLRREPCSATSPTLYGMEVVAYVGNSPRYLVRSVYYPDLCLVAYASSGLPSLHTCNPNWADQLWGFQYVRNEGGRPVHWLRNKHSGKCLALNAGYQPQVFMTTCGNYRDQLWFTPGP